MRLPERDAHPTVFIIEDDEAVRASLEALFRSVGLQVKLFSSADDFVARDHADSPGCMILDVRLPGKSGLDVYEEIIRTGIRRPVIFISGHADVPMSVRAMKAGATEFLTKPVRDQELLDAVQLAIERDRTHRAAAADASGLKSRFDTLTPREREVLALVVGGLRNKQIATTLGISEATVKLHRGNLMAKMQVDSLAALVRVVGALEGGSAN